MGDKYKGIGGGTGGFGREQDGSRGAGECGMAMGYSEGREGIR